ncbi:ferritin-like fold-containing protein [Luteococcus sp. OSA5]|uniref:ferritin-like fold-containing protein n=1 Tax=Luteococcus sp. OSA5 TaxID=3401630 RepID=UPI003B430CDC
MSQTQGTTGQTRQAKRAGARAEVQLLGLVAYGSLAAFERTAASSAAAQAVADKLVLARIAAQRFSHLDRLEGALAARGSGLNEAMTPFAAPIDAFNQHTEPRTWAEALVKLCIISGLVDDFANQVAEQLHDELREILMGSIDDAELASAPSAMLQQCLTENPDDRGRLALYGRRLLGEALSQAQRVSAQHAELTALLTGDGQGGDDLAQISELMTRLASMHARRMKDLGLAD